MNKLLELLRELPDEQKNIFVDKYLGILKAIKDIDEKMEFVNENGIKLKTAKGFARYFESDIKYLKKTFAKYEQEGLKDLVVNHPELFIYDCETIISRINACKVNNRPYMVDDNYAPFLFQDELWNLIQKQFDNIPEKEDPRRTSIEANDNIVDFEAPLELNVEKFERYQNISEIILRVKEAVGISNIRNDEDMVDVDEMITSLLVNGRDLTDRDIAKRCLDYIGIGEGIDSILDEIMANQVSEKRGY